MHPHFLQLFVRSEIDESPLQLLERFSAQTPDQYRIAGGKLGADLFPSEGRHFERKLEFSARRVHEWFAFSEVRAFLELFKMHRGALQAL